MSSSVEEKFSAAVKLIQSMPKNGSFQPSTELQLRFYSFFKQGTEGQCRGPKPGIWNIVSRTKWDAWNKLGNMPKEEAMQKYIDELKKIVETMAFTENVAKFLDALGPFYEVVYDNGSPVKLTKLEEALAARKGSDDKEIDSGYGTEMDKGTPTPEPHQESLAKPQIHEACITPVERSVSAKSFGSSMSLYDDFRSIAGSVASAYGSAYTLGSARDEISDDEFADADSDIERLRYRERCTCPSLAEDLKTVEDELKGTLQRLRHDVEEIKVRVATMEAVGVRSGRCKEALASWWPFPELSPQTTAFVVAWPFVAHFVLSYVMQRR